MVSQIGALVNDFRHKRTQLALPQIKPRTPASCPAETRPRARARAESSVMARIMVFVAALVVLALSCSAVDEAIVLRAGPSEVLCPCTACELRLPQALVIASTHIAVLGVYSGAEAAAALIRQMVQAGSAGPSSGALGPGTPFKSHSPKPTSCL